MVGGADADIIMDGVLIDIKTTKYLDFKRDYFDQLIGYYILSIIGYYILSIIGYYILSIIGGIDGIKEKLEIKELGVYFSRHGIMVKFPVKDVVKGFEIGDFIDWFKEEASEIFKK